MMWRNRKITFILTLISAIIGVMLATQIQSNLRPKVSESRSIAELRTTLLKENEKSKSLLDDISKHEQLLYQYETSLNDSESTTVMKEELNRVRKLAGLVSVEDRGIVLRIEENQLPMSLLPTDNPAPDLEELPNNIVIDEDLRWLVNELLAHGAKAISINENRLTSASSIRNVRETIQVDTKTIQPPFVIKALGEPQALISGLKLEGIESFFQSANKKVYMEEKERLSIPAFTGQRPIRFMKPLKGKGDS